MRHIAAIVLVACAATIARADSYLHQHVRVERNNGSKIVGEVLAEDDDLIKIKRGATGWTTIPRDEIEKIVSLESVWKDVVAKEAAAKTGEDWYQIALLLEKEGFDKGTIEERLKKALVADPNHDKSRKKLGYVKRQNERGETVWLDPNKAKAFDATSGAIKKDAAAQEERPWSEFRIVVKKPDNKPEYEIITNLPKDVAEDYATFMVQLKSQLVSLIEQQVYGKSGKKIQWMPNPCKVCKGAKGSCQRCGGSGEEPCSIFITNTHKMFMDLNPTPGMGGYFMPGPFPAGDRQESYGYITCERPIVAFHGQFGGTGNTFMVLSHEGTHQLEAKMWKGDASSLHMRPGWLTEGLACYFGDGLVIGAPDKKTGAREMHVDIARDRLAALKRRLKQPPHSPGNYTLKDFTSYGIREYQQDAGLYSFGWSLIYFMLNSKEKFKFGGKEIDLKEAFGNFFADNCEKGAVEAYRGVACLGLAKALGITNQKDAEPALDALEAMWRDYILKLPIKAVGDFDAKDKKKWVSQELKFEVSLPGGKSKKPKFNWALVSPEDLNSVIFEEAMSLTDGNARIIVGVHANAENYDIEDSLDFLYRGLVRSGYGRFESTEPSLTPPADGKPDERPTPVEGTLAGSGIETRTVTFKAKERTIKGYVENVRPKQQQVKMLICRTAAKIYQVILMADEDEWSKYEGELNEILSSFAVTGG